MRTRRIFRYSAVINLGALIIYITVQVINKYQICLIESNKRGIVDHIEEVVSVYRLRVHVWRTCSIATWCLHVFCDVQYEAEITYRPFFGQKHLGSAI